jgi:OOP family OmpA-OmpF porin
MMKHKASLLVSTLLLGQFIPAHAEQPDAEQLVGNVYGGIHGDYLIPDNDRLSGSNEFNRAGGVGAELGYRISNPVELRASYTRFAAELDRGSNIQGINQYGLDVLFFPTEQNFYVLGGGSLLDFNSKTEPTLNVGLGYRQYFTTQFAGYVEGKGNYQFDDKYTDAIAQVGLIYFFGSNDKVVEKVEPVAYVAPIAKDSDKDGVVDGTDQCPNTPIADKVDKVGCTIFTKEQLSYRLLVNFDNDKADVKPEFYGEIAKVATFLKQYPQVDVTIDGHTSEVGAAAYNQKLSEKRAQAVAKLLVSKYGIDAKRLVAVGYGETKLLDKSGTAKAAQMNRRIEINIDESRKVAVKR